MTTNYAITLGSYYNLFASNYNFVITRTSAAAGSNLNVLNLNNNEVQGLYIQNQSGGSYPLMLGLGSNASVVLRNCKFNTVAVADTRFPILYPSTYFVLDAYNCVFDYSSLTSNLTSQYIVNQGSTAFNGTLRFFGGQCIGANTSSYPFNLNGFTAGALEFYNFDFGNLQIANLGTITAPTNQFHNATFKIVGTASGPFDFHLEDNVQMVEWRQGQNYPTLNATLPDASNTPWSLKCFPRYAGRGRSAFCYLMSKLYNGTAATRTLTFEFLVNANYAPTLTTNAAASASATLSFASVPASVTPGMLVTGTGISGAVYVISTTSTTVTLSAAVTVASGATINFGLTGRDFYVDVEYWDASTGSTNAITSSQAVPAALNASTAAWSATVYGALSYQRYNISLTTPTAIKPNSIVQAFLRCTKTPAVNTDFFFLDPDFSII